MNFNRDDEVNRGNYRPGIFRKEYNSEGLDAARPGGEKRAAS
jgi:hypothetical protein